MFFKLLRVKLRVTIYRRGNLRVEISQNFFADVRHNHRVKIFQALVHAAEGLGSLDFLKNFFAPTRYERTNLVAHKAQIIAVVLHEKIFVDSEQLSEVFFQIFGGIFYSRKVRAVVGEKTSKTYVKIDGQTYKTPFGFIAVFPDNEGKGNGRTYRLNPIAIENGDEF